MCEFGTHFVEGELTLDVQSGRTYDLSASASEAGSGCNVSASSRG
jgi:hypothetical protein